MILVLDFRLKDDLHEIISNILWFLNFDNWQECVLLFSALQHDFSTLLRAGFHINTIF